MKPIKTYDQFVNESENPILMTKTLTTKVSVSFDIDWNESIGKVEDTFTLAMSPDSTGLYTIGEDIEKFNGIPEADVIRDVKAGKEKPEDALIYGMCNLMNGGSDIYFWTNGTRLSGYAKEHGVWPAVFEQVSHEAGVHLTRLILTRAIAKKKGINITNEDWVTFDYGAGEYSWPAVGDPNDKTQKIIMIDEEAFATAAGLVVQTVTPHFLKMASNYIQELKTLSI